MSTEKCSTRRKDTESRKRRLEESSLHDVETSSSKEQENLVKKGKKIQTYHLSYEIIGKPEDALDLMISFRKLLALSNMMRGIMSFKEAFEMERNISIIQAVRQFNGDLSKAKELLVDIDAFSDLCDNVLHMVFLIVFDNPIHKQNLVEFLVKERPYLLEKTDRFGRTPLHIALRHEADEKIIRLMLDHSTSHDLTDIHEDSLMHYAAQYHPGMIKLLLEYGISVNAKNKFRVTVLHTALLSKYGIEGLRYIKELLSHGAVINGSDLELAIHNNDMNLLKLLLSYGADPYKLLTEPMAFARYEHFKLVTLFGLFWGFSSARRQRRRTKPRQVYANEAEKNRMESFLQSCFEEVQQMGNDQLSNGSSYYDFICELFPGNRAELNSPIFDHILPRIHRYPSYKELILISIPREAFVLKLRTIPIYITTTCSKETIYLNSLCVDHLLKYLKKEDLLNLMVAFVEESTSEVAC